MTRKTILRALGVAVLATVFAGGYVLGDRGGADGDHGHGAATAAADDASTTWTCSMHPQFKLPEPGQCPICFMDLIPLEEDAGADDEGAATLAMSERAAALAEIRTVPVVRRAVDREVRLLGTVAYDETRYRTITARVPGRVEKLHVDFTGASVRAGEALVSLYSPALYAAQTELLNALAAEREVARSESRLVRETSAATVASVRRRLALWGLDERQIAAIERRGHPVDRLDIPAPVGGVVVRKDVVEGAYVETGTRLYTVADLSRVWIEMEAYESDLVWLDAGQALDFAVEALPGATFAGEIVFIDPVLDARTRTVRVRAEVANPDGNLKPGMFATANVAATTAGEPLVIPATAPLITGQRAVVYVRVPDRAQPTFTGRVVELGPRAGDHYVVNAGLAEGELVVVKGNFKIDSALQIQAKPSMMNPAGDGPVPGHDHGDHGDHAGHEEPADGGDEAPAEPVATPGAFRDQLDDVLTAYLVAQSALAADDDPAAAAAAGDVVAALADVDMSLLEGPAHAAWMEDLAPLRAAAAAFADAAGIDDRRVRLEALSDRLWAALRRYGSGREETVRRFHCPMVDGDRGADWIQTATETANPYFGAKMLRCGWQTDSLTVATGEGS